MAERVRYSHPDDEHFVSLVDDFDRHHLRWPESAPGDRAEQQVYDRHVAIGYTPTESRRKVADYRQAQR